MISLLQVDSPRELCQKIIYSLISMETKGETIPGPLSGTSTGKKGAQESRAVQTDVHRVGEVCSVSQYPQCRALPGTGVADAGQEQATPCILELNLQRSQGRWGWNLLEIYMERLER